MTLWGTCAGVDTAQPVGLPQCAACICAELPLSEEGQSPPVGIWTLQTRKAHRGDRVDAGHQTQTQKHNPGCSLSQLKLPERDTYITHVCSWACCGRRDKDASDALQGRGKDEPRQEGGGRETTQKLK